MNMQTLGVASRRKRRLLTHTLCGALCVTTIAVTAVACISTPRENDDAQSKSLIEAQDAFEEAGDLESGVTPMFTPKPKKTPFEEISERDTGTGPLVVVQCHDASRARFVLDREGGTHVLSGRFVSASSTASETATAEKVVFAEFSRALADNNSTLAFEALAGKVGNERLTELTFTDVDVRTGHVTVRYGKMQADFSGCVFNTAALQRMRGQEHLRFTLARG